MMTALYFAAFLATLPMWFPVVAIAFAIGRQQVSLRWFFLILTVEAIFIWVAIWAPKALLDMYGGGP
jgi:hypothetical protein